MILTLAIMAVAASAAFAMIRWQTRNQTLAPTAARGEPPTALDRRDFRSAESPWLIAVFTAATCSSCAAVLAELKSHQDGRLVVEEVEVAAAPELHRKYAIDSVPTAVIVDSSGDAKLAFVGPLGPDHRRALNDLLASPSPKRSNGS